MDFNKLVLRRTLELEDNLEAEHKDLDARHAKRIAKLPTVVEQLQKLLDLDVITDEKAKQFIMCGHIWNIVFITTDKFPALHAAFGECKLDENSKCIHSAERSELRFRLDLGEEYVGPSLYTIRKLTGKEKCKIVTVTETNTSTNLVCEKDGIEISIEDM